MNLNPFKRFPRASWSIVAYMLGLWTLPLMMDTASVDAAQVEAKDARITELEQTIDLLEANSFEANTRARQLDDYLAFQNATQGPKWLSRMAAWEAAITDRLDTMRNATALAAAGDREGAIWILEEDLRPGSLAVELIGADSSAHWRTDLERAAEGHGLIALLSVHQTEAYLLMCYEEDSASSACDAAIEELDQTRAVLATFQETTLAAARLQ